MKNKTQTKKQTMNSNTHSPCTLKVKIFFLRVQVGVGKEGQNTLLPPFLLTTSLRFLTSTKSLQRRLNSYTNHTMRLHRAMAERQKPSFIDREQPFPIVSAVNEPKHKTRMTLVLNSNPCSTKTRIININLCRGPLHTEIQLRFSFLTDINSLNLKSRSIKSRKFMSYTRRDCGYSGLSGQRNCLTARKQKHVQATAPQDG